MNPNEKNRIKRFTLTQRIFQLPKAIASALDIAVTQLPEEQAIINKEEVVTVLDRAASDATFFTKLLDDAADALRDYTLTGPEKLALLTGNIEWIEEHIGPLTRSQRRWLEVRKSAETW